MTKVKKPAVKAKTARRGRPPGSKNKPKGLEKQIAHWTAEPRQKSVDFKALAQKLQNALAASYVDVQRLEKELADLEDNIQIQNLQLIIKQRRVNELELLLSEAVHRGTFDMGNDEDAAV